MIYPFVPPLSGLVLSCLVFHALLCPVLSCLVLPPNLQYYGQDCEALAVAVGVGMNLVPISNKKAGIGTLFLSDLKRIMALLSDDGERRLLCWIQNNVSLFDTRSFRPR